MNTPRPFFKVSKDACEQITETFDFFTPTAVALWNLRWQVTIMKGNFLVPSLNESGEYVLRDFRYAHTAAEIDAWRDKVREERWIIYQTHIVAMKRTPSVIHRIPSD